MIIQEIGIRGFKSFGNSEQTLKLNSDKGELILLTGSNGNGKSDAYYNIGKVHWIANLKIVALLLSPR